MKKQLKDLKSWDVKRIEAMYEEHGMGRYGIEQVARSFSLTESAASAMATAIKDRDAPKTPSRAVTETDPLGSAPPTDTLDAFNQYRAAQLAAQVQRAESRASLADCSAQELEALAVRDFG